MKVHVQCNGINKPGGSSVLVLSSDFCSIKATTPVGALQLPLDGMLIHHRVPSIKQLHLLVHYSSLWMGC